MVTVHSVRNVDGNANIEYEFKGISTDEKPTEWGGKDIEQNSLFLELDTGKFYYFNGSDWSEVGA